jgi:hypothetical protein
MFSKALLRVRLLSFPTGGRGFLSGSCASRAAARSLTAAAMDSQSKKAGGTESAAAATPAAAAAPVRVAVAQMTSTADVQANFETVAGLAKVRTALVKSTALRCCGRL